MDYPFYIPFNFTTIAANSLANTEVVIPHDTLIHGMTTFVASFSATSPYRILFSDRYGAWSLSDEEISYFIFQTNAEKAWYLPSPLYIKKNTILNCRFNNQSSGTPTVQVCPFGVAYPQGTHDPGRRPFIYSFFFNLGYPDPTLSSATITGYNVSMSIPIGKPPLEWDFELTTVMFDYQTLAGSSLVAGFYQVEIYDRITKKVLFNVPCNHIHVTGGYVDNVLTANGLSAAGLNANNTWQHVLPTPVTFRKGSQLGCRAYQAPGFAASSYLEANYLNRTVNLALLGNQIYG